MPEMGKKFTIWLRGLISQTAGICRRGRKIRPVFQPEDFDCFFSKTRFVVCNIFLLINRQENGLICSAISYFLVIIPDNMQVCKEKFPIVTLP